LQPSDDLKVEESRQIFGNIERVVDRSQAYRSLLETHPQKLRIRNPNCHLEAQGNTDGESITKPYESVLDPDMQIVAHTVMAIVVVP
jgi:hypothetical protein